MARRVAVAAASGALALAHPAAAPVRSLAARLGEAPRRAMTTAASGRIRKAFVMGPVFEGMEEDYEKRHNPIWEELEVALKDHGAHNYSIYLHPETKQLFAFVEVEDEARWNRIAETDICQRWWKHMADVMPSNEDSSPVAVELKEVFHLA